MQLDGLILEPSKSIYGESGGLRTFETIIIRNSTIMANLINALRSLITTLQLY